MTYDNAIKMLKSKGLGEIPVYDVHCHIGGFGRQVIPDSGSPELLISLMDRLNINVSFISSLIAITGETVIGNNSMIEACQKYPGRIFGYAVFNPNDPIEYSLPHMENLIENKYVAGFKCHSTIHNAHPDDKRYYPLYELAVSNNLPILIHTWGTADVNSYNAVCSDFPDLKIIAAHAGGSIWSDVKMACETAKRFDNLYLDLCISIIREGQIEYMVKTCSADKVLFGSDISFFCPISSFGRVLFAEISYANREKILYKNAKSFFNNVFINDL